MLTGHVAFTRPGTRAIVPSTPTRLTPVAVCLKVMRATEVDTLPATVTEYMEQTQPVEVNTAEMDVETVSLDDSDN